MRRSKAIDELTAALGAERWGGKGDERIGGSLDGHRYVVELSAKVGQPTLVSVSIESCDMIVELRPARGVDRWHKQLLGGRRRTGDAAFDDGVFIVHNGAPWALRWLIDDEGFRRAALDATGKGLAATIAVNHVEAPWRGHEPVPTEAWVREAVVSLGAIGEQVNRLVRPANGDRSRETDMRDLVLFFAYMLPGIVPMVWLPCESSARTALIGALLATTVITWPLWAFLMRGGSLFRAPASLGGLFAVATGVVRNVPLTLWLTVAPNALLGGQPEETHHTQVMSTLGAGVTLRPWRQGQEPVSLRSPEKLVEGQRVKLTTRVGLLGWEYVTSPVRRDDGGP